MAANALGENVAEVFGMSELAMTTGPIDRTVEDDEFYPQNVEDVICRDFSCCGLVLNDLHDLLQHYEESHVRFDEESPYRMADCEGEWQGGEDQDSSAAIKRMGSYDANMSLRSGYKRGGEYGMGNEELSLDDSCDSDALTISVTPSACASDCECSPPLTPTTASVSTCASPLHSSEGYDWLDAESGLKRNNQSDLHYSGKNRKLRSDPFLGLSFASTALSLYKDDIIAAISSSTSSLFLVSDRNYSSESFNSSNKPYRCSVNGCDKAYKNPNGLKYHNLHGHCNVGVFGIAKPYKCPVPECNRAYKNLNGLKYHVQHAHSSVSCDISSLQEPEALESEIQ